MTGAQLIQARVENFEKMYDAFYTFFVERLRKDGSKFNKYKLQLLTEFWDDLELTKQLYPIFESFSSTLAEKRACARAALYEALVANSFGAFLGASADMVHGRIDALEKASGTLLTLHKTEIESLKKEMTLLKAKEHVHAIQEGQQDGEGKKARNKE